MKDNTNIFDYIKAEFIKTRFPKSIFFTLLSVLFEIIIFLIILNSDYMISDTNKIVGDQLFMLVTRFFLVIMFPFLMFYHINEIYGVEYKNKTIQKIKLLPVNHFEMFSAKFLIVFFHILLANIVLVIGLLIEAGVSTRANGAKIYEIDFEITKQYMAIAFNCSIASIPVIITHLFISSLKVKTVINFLIYLSVIIITFSLLAYGIKEQWYNFYLYPIYSINALSAALEKMTITNHFQFISTKNNPFIMTMVILYSAVMILVVKYGIGKYQSE